MTTTPAPQHNQSLRHFAIFLAASAAILGLIALVGWLLSIPILTSFWPGGIPMAPSTAAMFLLYGLAVQLGHGDTSIRHRWLLAKALSGIGVASSLTLLVLSLRNIHLSIEYLGLPVAGRIDGAPLGHMAPMTAFLFLIAGCSQLLLTPGHRKRVLASFWLAALLVFLSMILVVGYLVGAPLFYGTSLIPPAMATALACGFIGTSLLLLAGQSSSTAPFAPQPTIKNNAGIILVLFFLLLVTGIIGAGILYSRHIQHQFRTQVDSELSAIANLKARELDLWRQERLRDGMIFYQNETFSDLVRGFLGDTNTPEITRRLNSRLLKIFDHSEYAKVSLIDTSGSERLVLVNHPDQQPPVATQAYHEILVDRQVTLRDLHRQAPHLPPHLTVVVPIFASPLWQEPIAELRLEIDPYRYLFPMIGNWPTPSKSAETLLVRRDGDDVVFLNDLRFNQTASLNLRLPLNHNDLPAAMAILGKTGIVEGIDYHGKAVVAAIRSIPDSPWFMEARIDHEEITKPLRERLLTLFGMLSTLLFGVGTLVWLIWRNQNANFYRMQYETAQALEESERTLRILFDGARDGILVADTETKKFLIANPAICRMLGYSPEELLTLGIEDIHPKSELAWILEVFAQLVRGESSLALDIPMLCRDNSIFYADISSAPIQLAGEHRMLGTIRDISDRKQAEAKIKHLNRVLRAIRDVNHLMVQASSVDQLINNACQVLVERRSYASAVIILSDQGNMPIAHAHAGLGVDFSSLVDLLRENKLPECCAGAMQKDDIEVIHDHASQCQCCPLDSSCRQQQRMATRLKHQQKIYGCLVVSIEGDILMDQEEEELFAELAGDLAYALHNMRVLQEGQRAETEKKHLEDLFYQAQKMEAVGQLAGGIAHDFNNMLSIIIGYSTILEEEIMPTASSQEALTEIHDAAIRAKNLTRQLLAYSRKQILQMEIVDVNEVIVSFEKLLRRTIGEDIEMRLSLLSESLSVKADVSQLEQVLLNLVVNARDAMPDGGTLTIETSRISLDAHYAAEKPGSSVGPHVLISVSDNGCGMDAATKAKVFEPFFTTKAVGKGTGLGLSTVLGVIQQHGGTIWLYSEPGQGTTFKIYLPEVERTPSLGEQTTTTKPPNTVEATVLVVEDEPAVRRLACQILLRANYVVLESVNVAHAIELARDYPGPIHLLLTDVVMPTMKGTEVFSQVREHRPLIRVLYMSGYTENVIAHHGVLDKGVDFLPKPFTAEALLTQVYRSLVSPGSSITE